MPINIDHDQLFKRLLREFFLDFVELFLPAVRQYLELGSIEFLDTYGSLTFEQILRFTFS